MEVKFKTITEEVKQIEIPSYWENDNNIFFVKSEGICITVLKHLRGIYYGSPTVWLDADVKPCTAQEFIDLYAKTKNHIDNLIYSE